jgi:hypothetical protein
MVLQRAKSLFLCSTFLASFLDVVHAVVGAPSCVAFQSASGTFSIVSHSQAAPVFVSPDDWPGVQRAAGDFVADIQRVTGAKPALANLTVSGKSSSTSNLKVGHALPVFVGTLGRSALIDSIVNSTGLDVSGVRGQWEAYLSMEVKNPIPGVDSGYVIIGADKRGTIFALYEHSEQFGAKLISSLSLQPLLLFLLPLRHRKCN